MIEIVHENLEKVLAETETHVGGREEGVEENSVQVKTFVGIVLEALHLLLYEDLEEDFRLWDNVRKLRKIRKMRKLRKIRKTRKSRKIRKMRKMKNEKNEKNEKKQ